MSEPLRLRILKALTERLETITDDVVRGRISIGSDEPRPMLAILEAPQEAYLIPNNTMTPRTQGTWKLLLQGFVKDDRYHPTDPAHVFLHQTREVLKGIRGEAEGDKRMGLPGYYLGFKEISAFSYGLGIVRPAEEGVSSSAYFWLELNLEVADT